VTVLRSERTSTLANTSQTYLARIFETRRSVEHDLLQDCKVVDVSLSTGCCYSAQSLRPPVLYGFRKRDQLGLFENLQVPAQITVREGAKSLQIRESQASRMRD
jgi:hypothetical protein